MDENKLMAKKMMLKKLKEMAMAEDKEKIGQKMQKVIVAAPTVEGLEEGLSKAQKIIKARKKMKEKGGDEADELSMIKSIMKD